MAGLGAYPSSSKPRPGQGPTIKPVQWNEGEEVNHGREMDYYPHAFVSFNYFSMLESLVFAGEL